MNNSFLLSRLVFTGTVFLGTVSLAIPQKANAMSIYGFSKLEWEANILLNGNPIFFDAETDTRADIIANEGGGNAATFEPFIGGGFSDATQSYVDNGGAKSPPRNGAPVPENVFNPPQGSFPGIGGAIGPDFARGDAIACDLVVSGCGLDFFPNFDNNLAAANVAEVYVKGENDFLIDSGLAEGEWDLLSAPFIVGQGDVLNIDVGYLYDVKAGIEGWDSGELKEVESVVEWDLVVRDTSTGNIVANLGFQDIEGLSFQNALLEDLDGTNANPITESLTLSEGQELIAGDTYEIAIAGEERVTGSSQNDDPTKVPEPAFILGIFTVGGLGLSLKRKNKLSRVS